MSAPAPAGPRRIDTRAPRWVGGVTFVLAVATLLTALLVPIEDTLAGRILSPEWILLLVLWLLFAIGTIGGNQAHPVSILFRRLIKPRLRRPAELEDARPPRFALGVGLALTTIGLVLHAAGVPGGLAVASALVVIASFLQAFVGYCLGCQVYLLLVRSRLIRPKTPLAA